MAKSKKVFVYVRSRTSTPFSRVKPTRMTSTNARIVKKSMGSKYARVTKRRIKKRLSDYNLY